MALSDELVSELVKITNDRENSGDDNKVVYGVIVDDGTRQFVRIDGSGELTPVITTTELSAGERVSVSIENHTALVTGNISNPSIGVRQAGDLKTSIEQTAREIKLVAQRAEEAHSSISITADQIRSEVDDAIKDVNSSITQHAGQIESVIEKQEEHSRFLQTYEGFLFEDEDGTVKIDGGSVMLDGAITWNDLSSDVQTNIDSIEDTASSAYSTANSTKTLVNGFTITSGSKTYIDGEMIYTESIYADSLHLGGELTVYKTLTGNTVGGYMGWCTGWNSTKGIAIMHDVDEGQCVCTDAGARLSYGGDSQVTASPGGVYIIGSGWIRFGIDGENRAYISGTYFHGYGELTLGTSSFPWPAIYGETDSITTSDRNKKNSIEDLPEKYIELFDKLTPRRYKLNNGTSDRYHVGYIAQEVEEAMSEAGIDSKEFGGFIRDHERDDDGNIIGDEILMLRYGEFNAIYAAKIKQLENKIEQLEERLAALECKEGNP